MLIKCPDCGKDVSDAAIYCLNCGRPIAGHVDVTQEASPKEATDSLELEINPPESLPEGETQVAAADIETPPLQMQSTLQEQDVSSQENSSATKQEQAWRKPLAIFICGTLILGYILFCAIMKWKHLGGTLLVFIFLTLVGSIWRSLVPAKKQTSGDSKDDNK